jgi:hypothetical protein
MVVSFVVKSAAEISQLMYICGGEGHNKAAKDSIKYTAKQERGNLLYFYS